MKKLIMFLITLTLAFAGVFFTCISANAATPEFSFNDYEQRIVLTTSMPVYDGSTGYAFYTLGYLIKITDGSQSMQVFLEGGKDYNGLTYAVIINEFQQEHGTSGKNMANDFFYGGGGTLSLNTVFTIWQKGDVYDKNKYGDFRVQCGGYWGYVQAKINDTSNVATPTKEVSASNWSSQLKLFPVKFWNWSQKSYCWSYYAGYMNSAKSTAYPLSPSTFTSNTVKNYTAPYYASDWQNAAMMCEWSQSAVYATREYYNRTLTKAPSRNFKVSSITAPTSMTDSTQVTVLYSNDHRNQGIQTVPTNITLSGGDSIDYNLALDTDNSSGCYVTYTINGYSPGNQTLTASINGGTNGPHSYTESTYADNVMSKGIAVSISKDFGVWGLSAYNSSGASISSGSSAKVYENETMRLDVNWTNYKSGSYSNVPAQIYMNGALVCSDSLSFNGYGTIKKSYYINVGTGTGNRTLTAKINWDNHTSESDPTDNESSTSFDVSEYYEFSISNLTVTPSSVYQNQTVNVSFRTDNWNQTRAYSNIPVDVLVDGVVVKTDYINFSPYGVDLCNYTINMGSGIGNHTISARINWNNHSNEVNPDNNITGTATVNVMSSTNLQIEPITPNSEYRQGVEVMTAFRVSNIGSRDIVPTDNLKVSFNITYVDGTTRSISVPQKTNVVIPANSDNLVYFKWTVPQNTAGKVFTITATVNPDGAVNEISTADNSATIKSTIAAVVQSQTPDTQYESRAPAGFSLLSPPTIDNSVSSAVWSEWVYENGQFVKKNYGIAISQSAAPYLEPDPNSLSRVYQNGYWYIKSGYGFSLTYNGATTSVSGKLMPDSSDYTSVQNGYSLFPEFKYSGVVGSFRTLQNISGSVLEFYENPNGKNSARLHFIPIYMPDGDYVVQTSVYDLWTPAGMLSCTYNSTLKINGCIYDDFYATD